MQENLGFGESVSVTIIRAQPVWMKVIKDNWVLITVAIAVILYLYWKSKQRPKEEEKTWMF